MMQDFLNSLTPDIVFRSYLSNSFILNQMDQYMNEIDSGMRDKDDIDKDIEMLILSIQNMMPIDIINHGKKINKEEFINVVEKVKMESLSNVMFRRRN